MKFLLVLLLLTPLMARAQKLDDSALDAWVGGGRDGIIFAWSPYMPMSVLGREEIQGIADELGVELLTVVDPMVHGEVFGDPFIDSDELFNLGIMDHFPAVLAVRGGKIKRGVIQGYEVPSSLKELIIQHMELP